MNSILARGQRILLYLSGVYLVFILLLTTPFLQRHAIFLHAVGWPLFVEYEAPAKYGLAVHRSSNVYIDTPDNVRLGAWLYLPPGTPGDLSTPPSPSIVSASLSSHTTILVFHGNAATRAVKFRVEICSAYAAHFDANVLAIDYRGFGDSSGVPSEEGLVVDARAAFDWVVEKGTRREDVLLVGMSLGTGVASALGARLSDEGIGIKGVVLLAPFTNIKDLLNDYHFLGFLPVLQPLQPFPAVRELITTRYLRTRFNTTSAISRITSPVFIAHAKDDGDIPYAHSKALFNAALEPLLPTVPTVPIQTSKFKDFDFSAHRIAIEQRTAKRNEIVHAQNITGYGTVYRFNTHAGSEVVYVESLWGGHDRVGLQQTFIDVLANMFFGRE